MTFEELTKANEATKPTDIGKGKDYIEVNQRIKAFRMLFPNGAIITDLISNENGVCIFKASALDEDGKLLGTGTAYEKEGNGFINKTSYIENCETSAVGRALAMCGIGIDASIASKEEVENAKLNQDKPKETEKPKKRKEDPSAEAVEEAKLRTKILGYVNRNKFTKEEISKLCKYYKKNSLNELSAENCNHYIAMVSAQGGSIDE